MASANSLVVNLTAKTSQFERGINKAKRMLTNFANSAKRILSNIARTALNPTAILGTGLLGGISVYTIKGMADARMVQVQAEKKLEAVLNATGHAAGFSAQQMADYAAELQKITNFGDEVTISGMAVLASFKNIQGQVFKDTIRAAQDMSAVMGQDLQSSIVQLGKAINDPIKGLSALSRVGVTFTDEQKRLIASLQASGDLMGAQKVILAELQSEFGGAAAAMLNPFEQVANAFGDLQESLGAIAVDLLQSVLPAIQRVTEEVSAFALGFSQVEDKAGALGKILEGSFDVAIAAIKVKFIELIDWMKTATIEQGTRLATIGGGRLAVPGLQAGGQAAGAQQSDIASGIGQLLNMQGVMIRQAAGVTGAGGDPTAVAREQLQQAQTAFADLIKGIAAQAPKLPDVVPDMPKPESMAPAIASGLQSLLEKVKIKSDAVSWGVKGMFDRTKIRVGAFASMLENWLFSGKKKEDDGGGEKKRETRTAAALQRGSAEAYSAIVQAMMGSGDPTVSAIQKMQKAIVDQLKKSKPKGQQVEIAEAVP